MILFVGRKANGPAESGPTTRKGRNMQELNNMTAEQLKAEIEKLQQQLKATKGPASVEIVEYTSKGSGKTAKYVKTRGFFIPGGMAQGLFLRVEAVDQAIEALNKAKVLLGE